MTDIEPSSGTTTDTAQVTLKEVTELGELVALRELFDSAWGRSNNTSVVPLEVLRAASMSGNYVVAAMVGGELGGGGFGMLGMSGGAPYLHSHVLAVSAALRGQGLGLAVKHHQRQWALDRGLSSISWTFDPLVRRNAHFNLSRLGAHPTRYLVNWYGRRDDSIDAGEGDRFLVEWPVQLSADGPGGFPDSPTARAVADFEQMPIRLKDENSAPVVLDREESEPGTPFIAEIPDDIVRLRGRRPDLAAMWTLAFRQVVGGAMSRGYVVSGLRHNGYALMMPGDGA